VSDITKLTETLTDALEQKVALEGQINETWQQLRMERIAAIRGDADPGPLPFFHGLDPQQRASQERQEQLARDNRAIDLEQGLTAA
jgi:hypothetical protein